LRDSTERRPERRGFSGVTSTFIARLTAPVSADELFAWHERPGAFERLTPPWQQVRVLESSGGIRDGARVALRVSLLGRAGFTWRLEHEAYVAGRRFRDVQRSGPFGRWEHTHLVEPAGPAASTLTDSIEFAPPFPASLPGAALLFDAAFRPQLRRLFAYRHAVTASDLARHARFADRGSLRIAVSGATGLIGQQLCAFLGTGGHTVHRLVRPNRGAPLATDIAWDPDAGTIDAAALDGVDAVVHLAGEPVSERWTAEHKRKILQSRVAGTGLLARTLAALPRPPRAFISASAVGFYGDGGDRPLDESSPPGAGFLADVAAQWEAAAAPARDRGIRVVHPRFGVVLSARGGALAKLLTPFRLGAGGKLGSGQQWMSWISLDDTVGALQFLLFTESLAGPVNLTAPAPVTNEEFSRTLAHVLGRPALATVPPFALRLMFGEMADAVLLAGQRAAPSALVAAGFEFRHPGLEAALRFELGE
jgi:uncharacterized protein